MKTIFLNGKTLITCLLFSAVSINLAAQTIELVADINEIVNRQPNSFIPLDNLLLFTCHEDVYGRELRKSVGTTSGIQLLKNISVSGNSALMN